MAVKLRLQRKGRKKAPFYHIVAADSRSPRDGRFIEKVGTYNPLTVPATIELNRDRAFYWLMNGAEPTDTVNAILRFKGVLYQKHLAIGVKKGALTQEKADDMLANFVEHKEGRVTARKEQTAKAKADFIKKVDGKAKAVKKVEVAPVVEEVIEAVEAAAEPVVENVEPVVENVEAVVEVVVEPVVEAVEAVAEAAAEPAAEAVAEVAEAAPEATDAA